MRLIGVLGAGLCAVLCGCRQTDFPVEKAQGLIHYRPIHIDAEQVTLTPGQVNCGVQEDLWEPAAMVGEHTICRLMSAGRALNFDDDVILNEPGYNRPYVQIRGDFTATLADGPDIRDPDSDVRMVTGKLFISIPHSCFADALPLMGVRKGKFNEDTPPVMRFELQNDGWHFVKLVH